jgi:glycosyltransferase involved in cell wall biosynthesis
MLVNTSNNKKRVLLISPFASPNLGGVESHIDKLLKENARHKIHSILITYMPLTTKAKAPVYQRFDDWEIYRQNWFGNGWFDTLENYFPLSFAYLFPGLFWKSFWYYHKHNKEISCIHAHGLVAITIAVLLKLCHNKRIVVSTHAVYSFGRRKLLSMIIRKIFERADYILAVSEVSRDEIVAMGIDPSKVGVHPNWIDTSIFKPLVPEKLSVIKELSVYKFNVLFISRLIEKKGIRLFIDASKNLPNIGFHVVGDGPLREEVIDQEKKYKNLFYYKKLDQRIPEELNILLSLYNSNDVFIAPYTYDEGFSTTLIESCACGTPLIITRRGSPPTFLPESGVFYLPSKPQAEDLIKAIKLLSNDIPRLKKMGVIVRKHALNYFSPKNAEVIIKSYEIR